MLTLPPKVPKANSIVSTPTSVGSGNVAGSSISAMAHLIRHTSSVFPYASAVPVVAVGITDLQSLDILWTEPPLDAVIAQIQETTTANDSEDFYAKEKKKIVGTLATNELSHYVLQVRHAPTLTTAEADNPVGIIQTLIVAKADAADFAACLDELPKAVEDLRESWFSTELPPPSKADQLPTINAGDGMEGEVFDARQSLARNYVVDAMVSAVLSSKRHLEQLNYPSDQPRHYGWCVKGLQPGKPYQVRVGRLDPKSDRVLYFSPFTEAQTSTLIPSPPMHPPVICHIGTTSVCLLPPLQEKFSEEAWSRGDFLNNPTLAINRPKVQFAVCSDPSDVFALSPTPDGKMPRPDGYPDEFATYPSGVESVVVWQPTASDGTFHPDCRRRPGSSMSSSRSRPMSSGLSPSRPSSGRDLGMQVTCCGLKQATRYFVRARYISRHSYMSRKRRGPQVPGKLTPGSPNLLEGKPAEEDVNEPGSGGIYGLWGPAVEFTTDYFIPDQPAVVSDCVALTHDAATVKVHLPFSLGFSTIQNNSEGFADLHNCRVEVRVCKLPENPKVIKHYALTQRIQRFYDCYCPEKSEQSSEVAEKYLDNAERLMAVLEQRYRGTEQDAFENTILQRQQAKRLRDQYSMGIVRVLSKRGDSMVEDIDDDEALLGYALDKTFGAFGPVLNPALDFDESNFIRTHSFFLPPVGQLRHRGYADDVPYFVASASNDERPVLELRINGLEQAAKYAVGVLCRNMVGKLSPWEHCALLTTKALTVDPSTFTVSNVTPRSCFLQWTQCQRTASGESELCDYAIWRCTRPSTEVATSTTALDWLCVGVLQHSSTTSSNTNEESFLHPIHQYTIPVRPTQSCVSGKNLLGFTVAQLHPSTRYIFGVTCLAPLTVEGVRSNKLENSGLHQVELGNLIVVHCTTAPSAPLQPTKIKFVETKDAGSTSFHIEANVHSHSSPLLEVRLHLGMLRRQLLPGPFSEKIVPGTDTTCPCLNETKLHAKATLLSGLADVVRIDITHWLPGLPFCDNCLSKVDRLRKEQFEIRKKASDAKKGSLVVSMTPEQAVSPSQWLRKSAAQGHRSPMVTIGAAGQVHETEGQELLPLFVEIAVSASNQHGWSPAGTIETTIDASCFGF